MQKVLSTLFALLALAAALPAQTKIGSWHSNYYNKDLDISYEVLPNKAVAAYVVCGTKDYNNDCEWFRIRLVGKEKISDFISSLSKLKLQYVQLCQNYTVYEKVNADFNVLQFEVWCGDQYRSYALNKVDEFVFSSENDNHLLSRRVAFSKRSVFNYYKTEAAYGIVFSSSNEFDEIIGSLNEILRLTEDTGGPILMKNGTRWWYSDYYRKVFPIKTQGAGKKFSILIDISDKGSLEDVLSDMRPMTVTIQGEDNCIAFLNGMKELQRVYSNFLDVFHSTYSKASSSQNIVFPLSSLKCTKSYWDSSYAFGTWDLSDWNFTTDFQGQSVAWQLIGIGIHEGYFDYKGGIFFTSLSEIDEIIDAVSYYLKEYFSEQWL